MSSATAKSTSSGSESDAQAVMDQRKRKRMESNRESARRSRMRKQQHLDDLINQVTQLKGENTRVAMQIHALSQQFAKLDSENAILLTQVTELTDRLHSLNSVLRFMEEFSGVAMDIPQIPLLKPWQLPCPSQLITAAADVLQY